jgi:hypothetical protein
MPDLVDSIQGNCADFVILRLSAVYPFSLPKHLVEHTKAVDEVALRLCRPTRVVEGQ